MKNIFIIAAIVTYSFFNVSFALAEELSDKKISSILIQRSISNYSGSCACPYNRARNGSKCGRRSAYSKPGGYEPLCYEIDITTKMINGYKKRNK